MKRIIWIMAVLLSLSASGAWAEEIRHKVAEGDCLWNLHRKYNVSVKSIQDRNDMGKSTVIKLNHYLWIPDKATTAQTKNQTVKPATKRSSQKAVRTEVRKSQNHKKIVLPGIRNYNQENAGRDGYKGSLEEAAWLLGLVNEKEIGRTKVVFFDSDDKLDPNQIIQAGDKIKMTSGRNKVGEYISKFQFYTVKAAVYVDEEFMDYMYLSRWCGNWIWHEKKLIPLPPIIKEEPTLPPVVVTPPAEPEPPSIFVSKEEEKSILTEHELDAGTGIWQNNHHSAKGLWWFAEYKAHLRNLENELAGGTVRPAIGVFAKGDFGKVDNGYRWRNAGIGPEAGGAWTALTDKGYPQQVQIMFRTLWEHVHGANSSSGYKKVEDHFLLGEYAEYLRRVAPDLMHILYAEGWLDVSKSFNSTWSGDKASSRTGLAVGYMLHKDWNETWASRFGVQLGWTDQDNQWIANARIEMRYNDWLIFGPSLDYTLASAIEGAAGGWAYGLFIRGEFHWLVQGHYSEVQSEGVKASNVQILTY